MSRRGCSLPVNASGFDPHRASITGRFGQVSSLKKPYSPFEEVQREDISRLVRVWAMPPALALSTIRTKHEMNET
jgi:hypothetical protein